MLGFKRLLPLSNRVLIQRVEAATQTKGGILLPEASKDALNYGKVIAVGPGTTDRDGKHRACYVKGGETVLLPEYGGNKVPQNPKTPKPRLCLNFSVGNQED